MTNKNRITVEVPTWYHGFIYKYMWLMLTIAVIALLFVVYILYTSTEAIKQDAISYGLDKYDLQSCSCLTEDGGVILFSKDGSPDQEQLTLDTNISLWVNTK